MKYKKDAQIGMEYLMIVGFLTFVFIVTLGIAFYQNNILKDRIASNQVVNMANKIISSSESVFYSGEPSKITLVSYIPDSISSIQIIENSLLITFQTSSGENVISFPSNVPISGNINYTSGLRKIILEASNNTVVITS